jgi:flagellar hook-associated protein 3 FlgL
MTMRVTDSYMSSLLISDLNDSLSRLLDAQRTASSMRRVNTYSDDPRAVSNIQRYNELISSNDEYITNVTRSRLIVDGTDVALQDISSVLADVRVLSMRESSAIATSESMATAVIEVDNYINRLMDVLNTSIEGSYIFSGYQTDTAPFARSGGSVVYQGDDNTIYSRTGPNSTMPVNIPGSEFMGTQSSFLNGGEDVAPRVSLTTNLADLSLGEGWVPGLISVGDSLGNTYEIDLSSSLTLGDVITTINTATGGTITASINTEGTGLQFTGTGPLEVDEVDGGTTASSLGINDVSGGGVLTGHDIRPAATDATLLADIPSLSGSLPLGTIDVAWQGSTYNVDFSTATTLGDLKTIYEATVPNMEFNILDSSLQILGNTPEQFEISNGDATDTASLLGLEGNGTPSRLFGMLEDLKANLLSGDKVSIRATLTELKVIESGVYQMMMKNGGRQTDLDWSDEVLRQRDERLRTNLALELDADAASVATELSRAETSYQASLLVTSKLYSTNLMQYLR